jgi:hypothetical protein
VVTSAEPTPTRIFLSWAHLDRRLKDALLADLLPALGLLRDVRIEWWQDSHLTCGEDVIPGVVDRLDEADFGLLLLSTRYFGRPFIQRHELPRFAGTGADKGSLPVMLGPLPGFGPEWNLRGVERQVVFSQDGKSFAELPSAKRTIFANELAASVRRRLLGRNGYDTL